MATPTLAFDAIRPDYWASLALTMAVVVVALWWTRRMRSPWRTVLRAVVVLVVIREVLFDNPVIWQLYSMKLSAEDVGWRQESVIAHRRAQYLVQVERPRYLAVGSSQTDRIYGEYSLDHDELGTFILAGMTPVDLYLNRSQILQRSSDVILLYVSEFDLARKPPENAIVTAPRQGPALLRVWRTFHSVPMGHEYDGSMAELLLGEIFPEAKYGFVVRGGLDLFTQKVARRLGKTDPQPAAVSLDQRLTWLRESFDERYLPLNVRFLTDFVDAMVGRGRRVVIVEGSYSPLVHDDDLLELSDRVRGILRATSGRSENVRFFTRDEILDPGDVDFDDLTHVTEVTGQRMVRSLLARLEGRPIPARYNPAVEPAPRDEPWWLDRVDELRGRIQQAEEVGGIVFLGDSITQGWEKAGAEVWQRFFAPRHALNLGVGGDRTEHVLWRLRDAPLGSLRPRAVVLLVGTNNAVQKSLSADDIAAGIEAVVEELRAQLPRSQILLLGLLPRDAAEDPVRGKIARINRRIQELADEPLTRFLDIGELFLEPDGEVRRDLMPDRLHLSDEGYEIWARQLEAVLGPWISPR